MGRIPIVISLAVLLLPAAAASADEGNRRVRHQQGRVLTDSDHNSRARKIPRLRRAGDVTRKRGIISRETAIKRRKALEPLKKRLSTRGMRTVEAQYAEDLRKWAAQQDDRLLELQKIHTAYRRLKSYRDRAAANGEDTSRIDPRLKGMEKKMAALSEDIRLARVELQDMSGRYQARIRFMSHMMKSKHDTARTILKRTQ